MIIEFHFTLVGPQNLSLVLNSYKCILFETKQKGVGDREREKKIGTLQGGSCALPSLTRAQRQKNLEKKNVCRLTNSAHIKVSSQAYRIHEEL